jgi:hypothetical protein
MAKSFVTRQLRLAMRASSASLAPTSASGQHLFPDGFMQQPPRTAIAIHDPLSNPPYGARVLSAGALSMQEAERVAAAGLFGRDVDPRTSTCMGLLI